MAIIYTYPNKNAPVPDDLIVLTDSEDARKTKRAKLSSLKGGLNVVDSITAVLPVVASSSTKDITLSLSGLTGFGKKGQVIKVNSSATGLEYADEGGSGDTYTLSTVQDTNDVDIKLTSGSGTSDSQIKLVAGNNITLTDQGAAGVKIDSSGGGGKNTIKNQTGPNGTPTTLQGEYNIFNFVNYDPNDLRVFAQADPNNTDQVNIFFPPPDAPTYPPYFNEGAAAVVNNITEYSLIISTPGSNGNFNTGGWDDKQVHPGYNIDNFPSTTFVPGTSSQKILGFNATGQTTNPATVQVIIFDADETTELFNGTTTALDANGSQQIGANNRATITVSNYAQIVDPYGSATQYAANLSIVVNIKDILADNSLEGGRYKTRIIFTPDVSIPKPLLDPLQYPSAITFNDASVFGDDNPTSPDTSAVNFGSGAAENVGTFKYLSGVKYYTAGSTFSLDSTGIAGINGDTQGRTNSGIPGANTNLAFGSLANLNTNSVSDRAWLTPSTTATVSNWTNAWDKTGIGYGWDSFTIQNNDFSYRGVAGATTLTISDPWNNASTACPNVLNVLVLTETETTSDFVEKFEGESKRLNKANQSSNFTSWNSATTLSNQTYGTIANQPNNTSFSQACLISVANSPYTSLNGNLIASDEFFLSDGSTQANLSGLKPSGNPNYSGNSNNPVYFRKFGNSSTSNVAAFDINFVVGSGSSVTDINAALTAGTIKIYIRKVAQNDGTGGAGPNGNILNCGPGFQTTSGSNAFDDGASGNPDAISSCIRKSNSTSTSIKCSVGQFALAGGIFFEIQYHTSGIRLSQITVVFN